MTSKNENNVRFYYFVTQLLYTYKGYYLSPIKASTDVFFSVINFIFVFVSLGYIKRERLID